MALERLIHWQMSSDFIWLLEGTLLTIKNFWNKCLTSLIHEIDCFAHFDSDCTFDLSSLVAIVLFYLGNKQMYYMDPIWPVIWGLIGHSSAVHSIVISHWDVEVFEEHHIIFITLIAQIGKQSKDLCSTPFDMNLTLIWKWSSCETWRRPGCQGFYFCKCLIMGALMPYWIYSFYTIMYIKHIPLMAFLNFASSLILCVILLLTIPRYWHK